MRSSVAVLLAVPLLALAACGADGPADEAAAPMTSAAARLERQAAAPGASGTLVQIADVAEARRRVGLVQPEALAALLTDRDAREATWRILGPGARDLAGATGPVRAAVRVGSVSVVTDEGGRRVVGRGATARALGDATPERSVIQPVSPSAVQSCLGDAAGQTILGSGTLGSGSTIGVGLRSGADAPAGLKLVICVSPHYRKQLYGSIRAMERRFGRPDEQDPRAPVIGEDEIGEQQIAMGVVPVEQLSHDDLMDLLEGGDELLSLVPDPPR